MKRFRFTRLSWLSLVNLISGLVYGIGIGWTLGAQHGKMDGRWFLAILFFGWLAGSIGMILRGDIENEMRK
jgi:hypothetical protein